MITQPETGGAMITDSDYYYFYYYYYLCYKNNYSESY